MKNKKCEYDAEYISYVKNGESAAVYITRDIAKEVPTNGKWIDVISMGEKKHRDGRWDFTSFKVELFPRKIHPKYPPNIFDDEKKYITWKTAHEDIEKQRKKGYCGPQYIIKPRLVNKNKGKYEIKKAVWNKSFNCWVKEDWFVKSTCEWRDKKIPLKPKWEYEIVSVKKYK